MSTVRCGDHEPHVVTVPWWPERQRQQAFLYLIHLSVRLMAVIWPSTGRGPDSVQLPRSVGVPPGGFKLVSRLRRFCSADPSADTRVALIGQ